MHAPQVIQKNSQSAAPIVLARRNNRIKEKGDAPNLMEMVDTIKRQEVKDNEKEFNWNTRSKDEDYEVEASKFNFHAM